jgi:beta-lactamase class A
MAERPRNHIFYSYQTGSYQHKTPKRGKFGRWLIIFILIIAMLFAIMKGVMDSDNEPQNNSSPSVAEEAEMTPEPAKKTVDAEALQAGLEQTIQQQPFDVSVAVVELNTGEVILAGDSSPYVAASTTKVLSAVMYLQNVEQGKTTLTRSLAGRTAQEQLRLMINRSDNAAWDAVNRYLGESNIKVFANQQGLTSYDPYKNTISAKDMALLMAKISKREILNEVHTQLLYEWMQNTSEERFITANVPAGTKAYHKTGYLTDRVHDAAIVENGESPFVLVVFSKSLNNTAYNYAKGQELYRDITAKTLQAFSQP